MRKGLIAGVVILIALLALASYFLFFNKTVCQDNTCFSNAIVKCQKASYLANDNDTLKQYNILGKENGQCKINVKLLQVKTGSSENEALEGKDMNCFVDIGTLIMPDTNLNNCHGLLKEEIQSQVIERLHKQILENIGQIDNTIKG